MTAVELSYDTVELSDRGSGPSIRLNILEASRQCPRPFKKQARERKRGEGRQVCGRTDDDVRHEGHTEVL